MCLSKKEGFTSWNPSLWYNSLLLDNGHFTFDHIRVTTRHFLISEPPYIGAYTHRFSAVSAVPSFLAIAAQVDQLTPAVEDAQLVFVHRPAHYRSEEIVAAVAIR